MRFKFNSGVFQKLGKYIKASYFTSNLGSSILLYWKGGCEAQNHSILQGLIYFFFAFSILLPTQVNFYLHFFPFKSQSSQQRLAENVKWPQKKKKNLLHYVVITLSKYSSSSAIIAWSASCKCTIHYKVNQLFSCFSVLFCFFLQKVIFVEPSHSNPHRRV